MSHDSGEKKTYVSFDLLSGCQLLGSPGLRIDRHHNSIPSNNSSNSSYPFLDPFFYHHQDQEPKSQNSTNEQHQLFQEQQKQQHRNQMKQITNQLKNLNKTPTPISAIDSSIDWEEDPSITSSSPGIIVDGECHIEDPRFCPIEDYSSPHLFYWLYILRLQLAQWSQCFGDVSVNERHGSTKSLLCDDTGNVILTLDNLAFAYDHLLTRYLTVYMLLTYSPPHDLDPLTYLMEMYDPQSLPSFKDMSTLNFERFSYVNAAHLKITNENNENNDHDDHNENKDHDHHNEIHGTSNCSNQYPNINSGQDDPCNMTFPHYHSNVDHYRIPLWSFIHNRVCRGLKSPIKCGGLSAPLSPLEIVARFGHPNPDTLTTMFNRVCGLENSPISFEKGDIRENGRQESSDYICRFSWFNPHGFTEEAIGTWKKPQRERVDVFTTITPPPEEKKKQKKKKKKTTQSIEPKKKSTSSQKIVNTSYPWVVRREVVKEMKEKILGKAKNDKNQCVVALSAQWADNRLPPAPRAIAFSVKGERTTFLGPSKQQMKQSYVEGEMICPWPLYFGSKDGKVLYQRGQNVKFGEYIHLKAPLSTVVDTVQVIQPTEVPQGTTSVVPVNSRDSRALARASRSFARNSKCPPTTTSTAPPTTPKTSTTTKPSGYLERIKEQYDQAIELLPFKYNYDGDKLNDHLLSLLSNAQNNIKTTTTEQITQTSGLVTTTTPKTITTITISPTQALTTTTTTSTTSTTSTTTTITTTTQHSQPVLTFKDFIAPLHTPTSNQIDIDGTGQQSLLPPPFALLTPATATNNLYCLPNISPTASRDLNHGNHEYYTYNVVPNRSSSPFTARDFQSKRQRLANGDFINRNDDKL